MRKLIITILVFVVALAACSQNENRKPKTLKNKLTDGKEIVYVYDTKHKEIKKTDKVKKILVVTNGKAKTYSLSNSTKTLEDLSKKSDEEVIKFAKKADKKTFNKSKDKYIDMAELLVTIEGDNKRKNKKNKLEESEEIVTQLEKAKYQAPKSQQLNFSDVIKEKDGKKEIIQVPEPNDTYLSDMFAGTKRSVETFPVILSNELNSQKVSGNRYGGLQDKITKSNLNFVVKLKDNESKVTFDKVKSEK